MVRGPIDCSSPARWRLVGRCTASSGTANASDMGQRRGRVQDVQPRPFASQRLVRWGGLCYGYGPPAPVAQLDRAPVFGTGGWGFESLRARSAFPSGDGRLRPFSLGLIPAIARRRRLRHRPASARHRGRSRPGRRARSRSTGAGLRLRRSGDRGRRRGHRR